MGAPRKDQFSGCLIGQCLGDALGFPVEGYPPVICQQYVSGVLKTARAGEFGRSPFPSHLCYRLTDHGTWGFAQLVGLAYTCYELKMQQRHITLAAVRP